MITWERWATFALGVSTMLLVIMLSVLIARPGVAAWWMVYGCGSPVLGALGAPLLFIALRRARNPKRAKLRNRGSDGSVWTIIIFTLFTCAGSFAIPAIFEVVSKFQTPGEVVGGAGAKGQKLLPNQIPNADPPKPQDVPPQVK
jgi:hypothetical protein